MKIGPNSFKLECDISDVSGGKKWSLLWWYKLSHDHKSWILLMEYSTSSTYGYASRDVYDIRGRTDLFYDAKRQVFGIIYKEVRCIDAGVYQCRGKRYTHKAFSMDQTQTVIIVQGTYHFQVSENTVLKLVSINLIKISSTCRLCIATVMIWKHCVETNVHQSN